MLEANDAEAEVVDAGYVDTIIEAYVASVVDRPLRRLGVRGGSASEHCGEFGIVGGSVGKGCEDVGKECRLVDNLGSAENRPMKMRSSKGRGKLFLGEYGTKVMWVDDGVVTIPLFRVNPQVSRHGVRLRSELTRPEANDHVERRKEFRPASLTTREEFRCGKIFEVFVVGNDVDAKRRAFEVVSPRAEGLENGQ